MRLADVAVLILITGLFCPLYSNQLKVINQLDRKTHQSIQKRDSIRFISSSFRNACEGKGFSNLDEWESVCREMWMLDFIGWEKLEDAGGDLYLGKWKGPWGNGEVYCRKEN